MPTEDFLVEDGLSPRVPTMEAEPPIHGMECYEHTRGRRNAQPRVPRSNRVIPLISMPPVYRAEGGYGRCTPPTAYD